MILDDASSALDFATEAALRQEIFRLPFHPTILIVSQRTSSLMECDRILVLEEGTVIAQGRHEELLESCPLYAEIHASSMGTGKRGAAYA